MLTRHTSKDPENTAAGGHPAPVRKRAPDKTCHEWLGLRELTHYADISERTLRSWIYSPVDPLPAVKVCGKVLVRKSDFDRYLENHRVKQLEEINVDGIVRAILGGSTHGG